jgi:amino acid transporter
MELKLAGLRTAGPHNPHLRPPRRHQWHSVHHQRRFSSGPPGIAIRFALIGFIRFEVAAVFLDGSRKPERTIARAAFLAVLIAGVVHAISYWAMVEAGRLFEVVIVASDPLPVLAVVGGCGWRVASVVKIKLPTRPPPVLRPQ